MDINWNDTDKKLSTGLAHSESFINISHDHRHQKEVGWGQQVNCPFFFQPQGCLRNGGLCDIHGRDVPVRDTWWSCWGGSMLISDPTMSLSTLRLVVWLVYYMTCGLWSADVEGWGRDTCASRHYITTKVFKWTDWNSRPWNVLLLMWPTITPTLIVKIKIMIGILNTGSGRPKPLWSAHLTCRSAPNSVSLLF